MRVIPLAECSAHRWEGHCLTTGDCGQVHKQTCYTVLLCTSVSNLTWKVDSLFGVPFYWQFTKKKSRSHFSLSWLCFLFSEKDIILDSLIQLLLQGQHLFQFLFLRLRKSRQQKCYSLSDSNVCVPKQQHLLTQCTLTRQLHTLWKFCVRLAS